MSQSALTIKGDRAWSYNTAIMDVLPDGRRIGNVTKYSVTTSKHQTQARVRYCEVLVDNVPRGTDNLAEWYLRQKANGQECFFCQDTIRPGEPVVFDSEEKPAHRGCWAAEN